MLGGTEETGEFWIGIPFTVVLMVTCATLCEIGGEIGLFMV